MPLFKEVDGKFVQWMGEPLNDIRHPFNIEELWSDEELAEVGLYRPLDPDPIPAGKIATLTHPARVNGAVKYVHTLEDKVISSEEVNAERDLRIMEGFPFNGKIFDCTPESKTRIAGAGTLAGFAMGAGAQPGDFFWHGGSTPFTWIVKDNTMMQMDAQTTFAMAQAAAAWEEAHVFAARALKDMSPIPLDYRDNTHWPLQGI